MLFEHWECCMVLFELSVLCLYLGVPKKAVKYKTFACKIAQMEDSL